MADYIPQPIFNMPNRGAQRITHHVEVVSDPTPGGLQASVNAFLSGLMAIPESPQILSIDYRSIDIGGTAEYSAMVWYVLVE